MITFYLTAKIEDVHNRLHTVNDRSNNAVIIPSNDPPHGPITGPVSAYKQKIASGQLQHDQHQLGIVQSLENLHDELKSYSPSTGSSWFTKVLVVISVKCQKSLVYKGTCCHKCKMSKSLILRVIFSNAKNNKVGFYKTFTIEVLFIQS